MDDIDAVLTPELIALQEPPPDAYGCIEYLLDRAVEAGRVTDRDVALEAVLAREAETSPAVGKGVGLFHARTQAVRQATVAFTRSSEGVPLGDADAEPATLLFMLLAPADESGADDHLATLSSLSRALVHDEVRERLHDAESPAEVRNALTEAIT